MKADKLNLESLHNLIALYAIAYGDCADPFIDLTTRIKEIIIDLKEDKFELTKEYETGEMVEGVLLDRSTFELQNSNLDRSISKLETTLNKIEAERRRMSPNEDYCGNELDSYWAKTRRGGVLELFKFAKTLQKKHPIERIYKEQVLKQYNEVKKIYEAETFLHTTIEERLIIDKLLMLEVLKMECDAGIDIVPLSTKSIKIITLERGLALLEKMGISKPDKDGKIDPSKRKHPSAYLAMYSLIKGETWNSKSTKEIHEEILSELGAYVATSSIDLCRQPGTATNYFLEHLNTIHKLTS